MTDAVWQELAALIPAVEQINILGTGGPWTHPKFLDWLDFIDSQGVQIHITTSGDLINDARAARLGKLQHLRTLTFSIDSPDPDIYFEIRGQKLERALSDVHRTLENVKDPRVVRVHAVVMRKNIQSMSRFPQLLKQMGVGRLIIQGVNNTKHATRDMVPEYTAQEREVLINTRKVAEGHGILVSMLPTLPADLLYAGSAEHIDEAPKSLEDHAGSEIGGIQNRSTKIEQDEEIPINGATMARSRHVRTSALLRVWQAILRAMRHEQRLPDPLRQYLTRKIAGSRNASTKICLDPWEKLFVTRQGDVYPCETYHLQSSLGSLAGKSSEQLWLGEEFQRFRQSLVYGTNIGCRNCERRPTGIRPLKKFAALIVRADIRAGGESHILLKRFAGGEILIRLATSRPRDRATSQLFHESWISRNRLCCAAERKILPWELASFRFLSALPKQDGKPEALQFVVEGHCWHSQCGAHRGIARSSHGSMRVRSQWYQLVIH